MEKNEKLDLRTEIEKKREERNSQMIAYYKQLYAKHKDSKSNRLIKIIAQAFGVSNVTVYNTLRDNQVIATRKRTQTL